MDRNWLLRSRARPRSTQARASFGSARNKQFRDGQTVFRFEFGLFGQRYIRLDVPLRDTKSRAGSRAIRRYVQLDGSPEAVSKRVADLLFQRRLSWLVESRRSILLDLVTEGVRVVVHPRDQGGSGRVRLGARGLKGLDPTADQILGESSEAATGVIELVGLGMTAGKKSLIQRNGSSGSAATSVSIVAATSSRLLTNEKHSPSRMNVVGRRADSICRSIGSALLRGFVFIRRLRLLIPFSQFGTTLGSCQPVTAMNRRFSDLNSEALDFRAASELFAPYRKITLQALKTVRITTDRWGGCPTIGGLLFGTDLFCPVLMPEKTHGRALRNRRGVGVVNRQLVGTKCSPRTRISRCKKRILKGALHFHSGC